MLVTAPMRVTTTNETTIDSIITNISYGVMYVDYTAISDHFGQEALFNSEYYIREPKIKKFIKTDDN